METFQGKQRDKLLELVKEIEQLASVQENLYSVRVNISVLLKQVGANIIIHNAGIASTPRQSAAQIRKDIRGRFLEIRLANNPLYKCLSLT